MDAALSLVREQHAAELGTLRKQLSAQHSQREALLTQQVQQLEERLVECMRRQDGAAAAGGRGMGVANLEHAQRLFQETLSSLKKDVVAFVSNE